jgi:hypothetical protein
MSALEKASVHEDISDFVLFVKKEMKFIR